MPNDNTVMEDMVTLCDGVMTQFMPEEWLAMSHEEKVKWCEEFGLEHAHVIVEE